MIDVEDKNIVLIVADTLTAHHLPTYGYERDTAPFITELAEENMVVENAYANAPWTVPSHASLFSGKLPSEHGVTTGSVNFQSRSFVQDLQDKGYHTTGITANSLVSKDLNFDKGFQNFHEVFDFDTEDSEDLRRAAKEALKNPDLKTFKKGLKFLYNKIKGSSNRGAETIERIVKKEVKQNTQPNFLFINYTEVHLPYNPPVKYAKQFTDNPSEKISRNVKDHMNSDKPEIFYQGFPNCTDQELIDLYDASIKYLDQKLKSLYQYLNQELDDLIFIVTSDHGENFGEHGAYFHQCGIWEKSIRIPMIIAGDGTPNQNIKQNFSWKNTQKLILNGKIKTTETVYSEYAGWNKMTNMETDGEMSKTKKNYLSNQSKAAIKQQKGLIQNSNLPNIQFISNEKCYSEKQECYENQQELENKIKIMLGS